MQAEKTYTDHKALWPFLKRMLKYALKYKKWFYGFLFWIAVVSAIDAIFPLILLSLIDNELTPALEAAKSAMDAGQTVTLDYKPIAMYFGYFMLAGMIQVIGIYFFIKQTGRIQEYIMYDLREAMFRKLQKLSFSYYDKSASGWLLTRLTSDTDRVAEVISWGLLEAVWGIVMILFCLTALFIYSPQLALIVLLSLPVMLIVSIRIRVLILKYSRESRKINSELTAAYNEHINGIAVNKSTAQEKRVGEEFSQLASSMKRASYRSSLYTAFFLPIVLLFGAIAAAFVVFFGGKMAIAVPAGITVGVLTAAFDYALRIYNPIIDISVFYAQAQGSLSAGERIFSLIDEELTIKDKDEAKVVGKLKGEIVFDKVNFHYEASNPVLKDFSLTVPLGQSIALVGPTGEGKSTIVNLVSRFYDPQSGSVKVDGIDYDKITLQSLRRNMGVVLQTPHLFAGTIRENIVYGRRDAPDERIKAVLDMLGATFFLERLDEEVGENGGSLSMGEKQLLSFARAILADPAIFIMDEATSSIDTLTEAKIKTSIDKMLEGRTAFIIAHRLSTIKNCDRILVIKNGSILEDGSHKELMKAKGKYYSLYTRQLREETVFVK